MKTQKILNNKSVNTTYSFIRPELSINDFSLFSSVKNKIEYILLKNNKHLSYIMLKKAFDDDFFDLYINGEWIDLSDYDCFSFFQSQKSYNENVIRNAIYYELLSNLDEEQDNREDLEKNISEIADALYKDFEKMEEIYKIY